MKLYENEIQHPSFGLTSISRVHMGNGHYMCGTDLRPTNLIRICIEKDCVQVMSEHTGKHVHHGDKSYGERVEVEMTYSQFANMICSMNIGEGTPCNVLYYGKDHAIEQYTENVETEYEFNYKKLMKELRDQHEKYQQATEEIKSLIDKLPKSKQDSVLGVLRHLEMSITDSVPFFVKKCQEASEDIVNRAKTEIAHYVDSAVHQLGVNAISGGNPLETKLLTTNLDDIDITQE